jgi:hypothetical protein
MCYICEARGTVGENYKAAQKEIAIARRQLGRVPPYQADHFWGVGRDWTKPPSKRLWSLAELKEHGQKWRREHLT